ncbi:SigE family RNA polymerase sigma factor [Kribbella ginsengisoli]|uniref:RNA polymerase sigma factor 70 region 4 type 2 domain-containing protein n=1 Tax=Kribbella ginsengisoli TaxID=363865 RepID=A0ABP6YWQ9_9ACTN
MTQTDDDFAAYAAARYATLLRTAVLLGAKVDAAEDAVQAALVRCYRSWRAVRRADKTDAYVYKVLANTIAKSGRRRWHGEIPTEDVTEQVGHRGDYAGTVATAVTLRRALAALPIDQRAVLVLRFYADLSERQTAEVLGIAVGTVKSRTSRALAALEGSSALEGLEDRNA